MPKYNDLRQLTKIIPAEEIPIIIPTFNNLSYIKFMVNQLTELGLSESIIVCDNGSTHTGTVEYLDELSKTHNVVLWGRNLGPRVYMEAIDLLEEMPEYFIVTDPDLILNPNMPKNFIRKMKRILETYDVSKVGLAIEIYDEEERSRFFDAAQVEQWEKGQWANKIDKYVESDDLYSSFVDTTFCLVKKSSLLYNIKKYHGYSSCTFPAIRIAGRFTCRHMGWWKDQPLDKDEWEFYRQTHIWSSTEKEKRRLGY